MCGEPASPQKNHSSPATFLLCTQRALQRTSAHRPGQCQGQLPRLKVSFFFFCPHSLAHFEDKSVSSSVPTPCHQPEQNHSAVSLKTAQVAERPSSAKAPGDISCHATSHDVSGICNLIQTPIISTFHLT